MRSWKYIKRTKEENENQISVKDKKKLITADSQESIPQLSAEPKSRKGSFFQQQTSDKYTYQGKKVDLALLPDKYELLEEDVDVESMNDSGIQDDSTLSSRPVSDCYDSDDDIFREQTSVREKIARGWNGERAKSARRVSACSYW